MSGQERLPYPGLRAFNKEEADLFFGRDGDVSDLIDRLSQTRFLAVLGASGTGKSSLVRTGLLDGLEIGLHPVGANWRFCDFTPGGQPIRNLARGLLDLTADEDAPEEIAEEAVETLEWFLRQGPKSLIRWMQEGHVSDDTQLLVLVDQFEELFRFSGYDDREVAEAFVKLLIEASRDETSRIHVVITMRSEYLGACVLVPELAETINAGTYLTPRMHREACKMAIIGPARMFGADVEPDLLNTLLNDLEVFAPFEEDGKRGDQIRSLSRRADQLPVMQHVLNRVWAAEEEGTGKKILRLATYDRLGGLSGALDNHGQEVMEAMGEANVAHCERIFRALTDGATIATARRRPLSLADIITETALPEAEVRAVIEAFRAPDVNFLRPDQAQRLNLDTVVDISHESLIRQWSRLSDWLLSEARGAAVIRRLSDAKDRHEAGEGDLLSGLDLANIAHWWDNEHPSPAHVARYVGDFEGLEAFLRRSQSEEQHRLATEADRERRERRRLRVFASIASLIAVVAVSALWWAVIQRDAAISAEEDAVAAQVTAEEAERDADIARIQALRNFEEARTMATVAERNEADLLDYAEEATDGLINILENGRNISAASAFGIIEVAHSPFALLDETRGDDPEFAALRARTLLLSLELLGRSGYWTEAIPYVDELESLRSTPPEGWEPDHLFQLQSAILLAEHDLAGGRGEQAIARLAEARAALESASSVTTDGVAEEARYPTDSPNEQSAYLREAARLIALEARLALAHQDFDQSWQLAQEAWALFDPQANWLKTPAAQEAQSTDPESFAPHMRAIAELARVVAQTHDVAARGVFVADIDERFEFDPQLFETRARLAVEVLDETGFPGLRDLAQIDENLILARLANNRDDSDPAAMGFVNAAVELAEDLVAGDPSNRAYPVLLMRTLDARANYAADLELFAQAHADISATEELLLHARAQGLPWYQRARAESFLHFRRFDVLRQEALEDNEDALHHALRIQEASIDNLRQHPHANPDLMNFAPVLLAWSLLDAVRADLLDYGNVSDDVEREFALLPIPPEGSDRTYHTLVQRQWIYGHILSLGPSDLTQGRWMEVFAEARQELEMMLNIAPGTFRAQQARLQYDWNAGYRAAAIGNVEQAQEFYRASINLAQHLLALPTIGTIDHASLMEQIQQLHLDLLLLGHDRFQPEDLETLQRTAGEIFPIDPDETSSDPDNLGDNTYAEPDLALLDNLTLLADKMDSDQGFENVGLPDRMRSLVEQLSVLATGVSAAHDEELPDETGSENSVLMAQLTEIDRESTVASEGRAFWAYPPLMDGHWRTLLSEASEAMMEALPEDIDREDISFIRTMALPFYETGELVEVQLGFAEEARIFTYLVFEDGSSYHLEGYSDQFTNAHAIHGFDVSTVEQAAAYARFYTTYSSGGAGAFAIVESAADVPFTAEATSADRDRAQRLMRPFVIWPDPEVEGGWQATATVYYDRRLYHVLAEFGPDGTWQYVADYVALEDLRADLIQIEDRETGQATTITTIDAIDLTRLGVADALTDGDRAEQALALSLAMPEGAERAALRRDYAAFLLLESYEHVDEDFADWRNSVSYQMLVAGVDFDIALELGRLAHLKDPESPFIADTYGWALVLSGDVEDGVALLEQSHEADTGQAEITAHLAQGYRLLGRYDDALEMINTARGMNPNAFWSDFLDEQAALLP